MSFACADGGIARKLSDAGCMAHISQIAVDDDLIDGVIVLLVRTTRSRAGRRLRMKKNIAASIREEYRPESHGSAFLDDFHHG